MKKEKLARQVELQDPEVQLVLQDQMEPQDQTEAQVQTVKRGRKDPLEIRNQAPQLVLSMRMATQKFVPTKMIR